MIYCIDSHTFIWGIKKQADEHDRYKLEEAAQLIKWFDDSKHQILVPSIIIAECLIREPQEKHADIMARAVKRFMVVDFDSRCSLKYGELLRLDNWISAKNTARENDIRREKMKIDHMILACALVNGAKGIFTEDKEFIKFIGNRISVFSPTNLPKQASLFDEIIK